MQLDLAMSIRLEGFQAEKDSVLKLLESKYNKLQHAYSQDIEALKEWQVKNMQKDADELNLLLGFVTQVEDLISALSNQSQLVQEQQQWWDKTKDVRDWLDNSARTHSLALKYKNIFKEIKQLKASL